jgi:hypothetical protein
MMPHQKTLKNIPLIFFPFLSFLVREKKNHVKNNGLKFKIFKYYYYDKKN